MMIEQKILMALAAAFVALAGYLLLAFLGVIPVRLETALDVCRWFALVAIPIALLVRYSARRRHDS